MIVNQTEEMSAETGSPSIREKETINVQTELENNKKETNDFISLTIATTNIRGLTNDAKRNLWFAQWHTQNWDIVITTETNSRRETENFWKNELYTTFWTSGTQHIGEGIGIGIKTQLSKRIIRKEMVEGRAICIDLAFPRNKYLRVIGIYSHATLSKRTQLEITVSKWTEQANKENWEVILGGDLNNVHRPALDRQSSTKNKHKNKWATSSIIINNMVGNNMIDTFRHVNPQKKEYTWKNSRNSASRIDMIWTTDKGSNIIQTADIVTLDKEIQDTDHNIATTQIEFLELADKRQPNRRRTPNIRYDWTRTNKKQWQKWTKQIEERCDTMLEEINKEQQNDPNTQWNKLREIILQANSDHIKRVKKRKCYSRNKEAITNSQNAINIIGISQIIQGVTEVMGGNAKRETENKIKKLAEIYKETIGQPTSWTTQHLGEWLREIRQYRKTLQNIHKTTLMETKKNAIARALERRRNWLETDKKKMINNILDSKRKQIALDRIITQEEETKVITNEEEIKKKVKEHFENWTTKGTHKNIKEEWKHDYEPIRHVKDSWYSELMVEITSEEIKSVLQTVSNISAPGPSQIPYRAIKNLGSKALEAIRRIFNNTMSTRKMPTDWKNGTIYPIPKTMDWENDLSKVRPITLLEAIKKIFTKIMTQRLTKVLTNHPILSEHNWAALPKLSTREPIRIVNSVIENANQYNKECWMVFQDMSKAYDNVNINMLTHALRRIKVPEMFIEMVKENFENRRNTVITATGNTDPYSVQGGIDQGDTISPILWRIYYDPLITRVSRMKGYTYVTKQLLQMPEKTNIAVAAYMDDTTWIAGNQEDTQSIIDTAESFYEMTDIKANPLKTHMVVTGIQGPKTLRFKNTTIERTQDPVRYLGIWIQEGKQKAFQKQILREKTEQITNKINWKKVTDKQMIYVLNNVLFPRIEYLLNDMVLTQQETEKINRRIRHTTKRKLGFANTAPNSLFHSDMGYKVFDLHTRQVQKHMADIQTQGNMNNIVSYIIRANITNIQWSAWTTTPILTKCPKLFKSNQNFTHDLIRNGQRYNIRIEAQKNKTKEEKYTNELTPIEGIMGHKWFDRNREKLRKTKLRWIEQMCNADVTKINSWIGIAKNLGRNTQGRIPAFYEEIREKITKATDQQRRELKEPGNKVNVFNRGVETSRYSAKEIKARNLDWMVITTEENPIIGRLRKKEEGISTFRHYKQQTSSSPLVPCTGCSRNTHADNRGEICTVIAENKDCFSIKAAKTKQSNSSAVREETKLRTMTSPASIKFLQEKYKEEIERQQCEVTINGKASQEAEEFFTNNVIRNVLKKAAQKTKDWKNTVIYTDGGVKNNNHTIAVKIINKEELSETVTFSAKIKGKVTASKAELQAIKVAVGIIPREGKATIYTDSKSAIKAINNGNRKGRQREISEAINDRIKKKRAQIKIEYMRRCEDIHAREVDTETKRARKNWIREEGNLEDNKTRFTFKIGKKTCEREIRTEIRDMFERRYRAEWYTMGRNQLLMTKHKKIDWKETIRCRNFTKMTSGSTNSEDQKIRTFNNKLWLQELPTMTRNNERRPDIYKTSKCTRCRKEVEDNKHVFECEQNEILVTEMITQVIAMKAAQHTKMSSSKIKSWVRNVTEKEKEEWCWLITRGVIPKEITMTVERWLKNKTKMTKVVKEIMYTITRILNRIWSDRCEEVNKWEKEEGITKQMKRDRTRWGSTSKKIEKKETNTLEQYSSISIKTINIFNYVYNSYIVNVNTTLA